MISIILAGGSGTRFWPLSRRERPKQLLPILGDERPMIEVTYDRLAAISDGDQPVRIICRPSLVSPTREALGADHPAEFIEEPAARNTAPAIALGAICMEQRYGDEPIAFFPADHFVAGKAGFERCTHFAAERARQGAIITLGIPPTRPETGYGYIETTRPIDDDCDAPRTYDVEGFVEKPDHRRALQYLQSGRYLWNAGIFVLKPSTLWTELRRQQPEMWTIVDKMRSLLAAHPDEPRRLDTLFGELEAISIDYAVMEGADRVEVIPALFRWSDVGHWAAIDEVSETDDANNLVDADALLDDVSDSVIISRNSSRLIAASGLQDMVIVDTDDALLVMPKKRAQKVRDIVEELKRLHRDELL